MSGMLGQLLGGLMGGGQPGQQPPLVGILQQVLAAKDSNGNSGVAAIVSKFQGAGLGSQVQSWVGTGSNQAVSPDHVGQVFAPEQIDAWANQAGTTPDAIRQVLAEALPHVVDHMTPGGQVPPTTQTADLSGLLQSALTSFAASHRA